VAPGTGTTVSPRTVLLTGDGRRHRYAAVRLAERLGLAGILSEAKPTEPLGGSPESETARSILGRHFAARDAAEEKILGLMVEFPRGIPVRTVPAGASNAPETLEWVRARAPDAILLYGTSIIRPPLLEAFRDRVVNMHLGLSPYYRGAGTNFWPLVDRRPECVGVTVHLATSEVDAGPILGQIRPPMETQDRSHEIGTRAIMAGLEALIALLPLYLEGRIRPISQTPSSSPAYRRKDFSADAVLRMERQFETGMLEEYVSEKTERDRRYPIVAVAGA
jgi:folate-dependent phosphoribosylglycinamide formyltransferase PurN